MTNISNLHTCPISRMHLLIAMVLVPHGQALQFASDVISGACVHIPIRIHSIRVGCGGRRRTLLWWTIEVAVIPFETPMSGVALLATDLAKHTGLEVATMAAVGASTSGVSSSATIIATSAETPTASAAIAGVVGEVGGHCCDRPWQ